MTDNLVAVSRATLGHLRDWVAQGKVAVPIQPLPLRERGIEPSSAELLVRVLGELSRDPLLAVLDTLIIERDRVERERPRLLWTGPEAQGSGALDTRVKLLELVRGAKESVFWAGYHFDDRTLVEPLYETMCKRPLDVTMVLEVKSDSKDGRSKAERIRVAIDRFFGEIWVWQDIRPRVYIDPRTAGWNFDPEHPKGGYYAQMHAKVVVIDAEHCIVGSANFTDAGTTRNIEAGVLLRSEGFARAVLGQWRGLIGSSQLHEIND